MEEPPKFQNVETIHEAEGLEMINKVQGCLYIFFVALRFHKQLLMI